MIKADLCAIKICKTCKLLLWVKWAISQNWKNKRLLKAIRPIIATFLKQHSLRNSCELPCLKWIVNGELVP